MRGEIVVTSEAYAAMIDHAIREAPLEAVGFLVGSRSGPAVCTRPLRIHGGGMSFLVDARDQYDAEREIVRERLRVSAIYHSHPNGSAKMSPLDEHFALGRREYQVVIALDRTRCIDVAAFRMTPRGPRPIGLRTTALGK